MAYQNAKKKNPGTVIDVIVLLQVPKQCMLGLRVP